MGAQRIVATVIACGVLGSCEQQRNEIVHPTHENTPSRSGFSVRKDSIPEGLTPSALSDWVQVRGALLEAQPVVQIGRLGSSGGEDPQVFGLISDVKLDKDGNVYVLDRRNRQVRIFDFQGEFLGAFGRSGPGPNEFHDPSGLELMREGRVAVSDRGNELKIFSPTDTGNTSYEHEYTVQLLLVPEGVCSNRERVFVAGWLRSDNTIIHEVAVVPGQTDHSFGHGYDSDNWLVQGQLSDGRIACLGDPLHIVFAFELLPVLRAYEADGGALAWAAGIEGYAQLKITESSSSDGQPSVRFSSSGVRDVLSSVQAVSSRHVLVQYLRGEPSEIQKGSSDIIVRSYLIDVATGLGALISETLPIIVAADASRQVAMWMLPYPKLELRTIAPKGGA